MKIRESEAKYWLEDQEHHLDVRPILELGGEPFSVIMDAVGQLEATELLIVHAYFDPVPLKKQLEKMGFSHESQKIEDDHWCLRIRQV
jgi:uncharacterized protein (DUF2249 family)